MRWPGMDRSRLGRGELVLYPYIATAGEAPGRAAGGVGFRSGYARPTAAPTGQLRVADRPMSLSRERKPALNTPDPLGAAGFEPLSAAWIHGTMFMFCS